MGSILWAGCVAPKCDLGRLQTVWTLWGDVSPVFTPGVAWSGPRWGIFDTVMPQGSISNMRMSLGALVGVENAPERGTRAQRVLPPRPSTHYKGERTRALF